jgi:hypothetical protein
MIQFSTMRLKAPKKLKRICPQNASEKRRRADVGSGCAFVVRGMDSPFLTAHPFSMNRWEHSTFNAQHPRFTFEKMNAAEDCRTPGRYRVCRAVVDIFSELRASRSSALREQTL